MIFKRDNEKKLKSMKRAYIASLGQTYIARLCAESCGKTVVEVLSGLEDKDAATRRQMSKIRKALLEERFG